MRGLLSILSLFRNEFNTVNNTEARMLDAFYDMRLNFFSKSYCWRLKRHF